VDETRLDAVLADWREREDRGEDVDLEALVAENPEFADALRARFAAAGAFDAAFAPAAEDDELPTEIGGWRVVRELGRGGMGVVCLAEKDGARAALKFVHPHLLRSSGAFKRFLREAEVGKRIRHANVVATLDADAIEADGRTRLFLVMEYVEGQTLRGLADELGRVPEELCRHVGREAAKGLAAIHAAGAVHRDVKPDNLIVTPDHAVKLMDLGVARSDDDVRVSQTGAFVGSLEYAAPEQFGRGAPVDHRADLHALGVVLYELATGAHPFRADDFASVMRRVLDEKPRRASELNPQLSPFFEELVAQLLAKDPADRVQSADDVARILEAGEESPWWKNRAKAIRAETKRPLRRIRIPRETALYGRDAELAKLRAAFDAAKAGDGRVVLIEGEAGIGKSRLVDEFVGMLERGFGFVVPASAGSLPSSGTTNDPPEGGTTSQAEDLNFLFGSYPPGGAATASGAFSTAYREHLGDDEAAVREALPVTPLLVPAFAALLRGDAAPAGAEPLTKDSLQTVFVHATRSFAAQRPTIVLIDDLHFAPEEGRALFMSLALAVQGHRVLLVGTARPGVDEKWLTSLDRLAQASRIALPRLGIKDLVRLLADSLKSEHLAEELAVRIGTKSDGNPFFVFEILRGLREGQFLAQRPDGTWHTTQVVRDIQIPSSVLDLVNARVADLDEEERDLLDVAACVGFEFDPSLVAAALGAPVLPTLKRFGQIERKHRLVRSAGRRMVFDHHQVQEALYGGLMEQVREHYHAALGDAIERASEAGVKTPSDLDGATCVDLAEHFLKGGLGARALRHLDPALTHLEKGYVNDAAVRLSDRALAIDGLVVGVARCRLLLRKASRLDLLGRREDEAAVLKEARSLAEASSDADLRTRAHRALGMHFWATSQFDAAKREWNASLTLAQEVGDKRSEIYAAGNLGLVHFELGDYAGATAHVEQGLSAAQGTGDRLGECSFLGHLGNALFAMSRFVEAQAHYERSAAIAREIGNRRGECTAAGNVGMVLHMLGRYAEAQTHFKRQSAIAREIGYRRGETVAAGNTGNAVRELGLYAEAQGHLEQQLALAREIGDRRSTAIALVNLGPTRLAMGQPAQARADLESSLEICREIGTRYPEGYALHCLGSVADETGDAARAFARTEEALALRREIGHADGVAASLSQLGSLRRRAGDAESARTAFEESVSLSRSQGRKAQIALGLAGMATLPAGDARVAEEALEDAGATLAAGDAVQIRFLLWQATRDRAHLAEAKRLLDFLVAHAPSDSRGPMLANFRLHREIAEAAARLGV
jgi:tetratricopeptide (TPR) repeat protein